MTAPTTTARGAAAEALAVEYICGRGYRIIAQNHRCAGGEVDIIAYDGEVLCFVEVRSKANEDLGHPLETIDRRKIARIVKASRNFLTRLEGPWPPMRFDVIGIVMNEPPDITLVQDAFEA